MADVDHPVLASKKVIRDKYLFACATLECFVCTYMGLHETRACPGCEVIGAKLRDPLPEHVTRLHVPLDEAALENA